MATDDIGKTISLPASGDLSAAQYKFIVTSSGKAAVAGAGASAVGVLQNDPDAVDRAATVAIEGIVKVVAGAAFSLDAEIMSDASGRAITATSTNMILGTALEAATAAGQIVKVLFQKNGVKA